MYEIAETRRFDVLIGGIGGMSSFGSADFFLRLAIVDALDFCRRLAIVEALELARESDSASGKLGPSDFRRKNLDRERVVFAVEGRLCGVSTEMTESLTEPGL